MNNRSFVRSSGLWLILGVIFGTPVGLSPLVFPFPNPSPAFTIRQVLVDIFHLMVLVAIIGLARSGAAGKGWLAKSGLGLDLAGGALFIAAELILVFAAQVGATLDGIRSILLGMGLVLGGIAVLRTQHWHGWHRFTPLLAGLYLFFPLLRS